MRYPVVVHKDEDSCYGVTVPDLPGCFSAGDTLEEALEMTQEAILCHVEGLLMDAQPIPEQQPWEVHRADPYCADGLWALVDVDLSKVSGKTVQVNITMPAPILALTDDVARREGETRSGFLARAVLEYAQRKAVA